MRLYQAVLSRRSCCLRLVAKRRARTLLPIRRVVRCSSMVPMVSSLIHWCFFLRRGPITAWLVSFRVFLPSFQRFSVGEADSSDSDRSANRLCSFSTKFRCVVWSSSLSTARGDEVSCGKERRFKRSEQVAATRRWSVLLPQYALRYTRQFWTMFHRAETMKYSNSFFLQPSFDIQVQRCMLRRLNQEPVIFSRCRAQRSGSRSPLSFLLPGECGPEY